jgi:3-oxoacyl-(acyl-carrier-protein) synthase
VTFGFGGLPSSACASSFASFDTGVWYVTSRHAPIRIRNASAAYSTVAWPRCIG